MGDPIDLKFSGTFLGTISAMKGLGKLSYQSSMILYKLMEIGKITRSKTWLILLRLVHLPAKALGSWGPSWGGLMETLEPFGT